MPDIYPIPQSIASPDSFTETPIPDKDLDAYRYAKALCETARSAAGMKVKSFQSNWDFLRGRNQWALAGNTAAQKMDEWSFRGVVNWCYAVIKTKAAMICGAPSDVFCDPLDDQSTYYDRLLVKSVIEDDLARLYFNDVKRDAYLSGSVTGVGISMMTTKPDVLTGTKKTVLTPIRSDEFFRDPSSDSTRSPNCRFVVWEPELDMSVIREMFPSKAPQVKPDVRTVVGGFTYKLDNTDSNLIYGTSGDFSIDKNNTLQARKARVAFVWIRDESLIEDLHEVIIAKASEGIACVSCGAVYEQGVMGAGLNDPCPMCGGDMEPTEIPAKSTTNKVIRRAYPYGRLIVYSGDTLLYDGENPYEVETVFPFAVYKHDPIPGDFYGENDVALLHSLQTEQNRTVGQLIDYIRLAVNAPVCYPVNYKAFTELGNGPAQRLPGPERLSWQPFRLSPQGFDVQSWGALHGALTQHFQVLSGLAQSLNGPSSPPISATEAEISNARLSDRMKGHAQEFSTYCSEVASLDDQIGRQISREEDEEAQARGDQSPETNYMVTMPDSTVKSICIQRHKLPKVSVRVVINTEISIKDKLQGQNLMAFTTPGPTGQSGMDSPYADITLGKLGFSDSEIKEFMARRGLQQELMPPGTGNGQPLTPDAAPPTAPQPMPQGGM